MYICLLLEDKYTMLDKLLKNTEKISDDIKTKELNSFLIALYGSEENAINEINQLSDGKKISDENLGKLLKIQSLNTIQDITENLLGNGGVLDCIKNINSINDICKESSKEIQKEDIPELTKVIDAIATTSKKILPNSNSEEYSIKKLEKTLSFKMTFSKEEMALELGISKKSFNKFLDEFYGKRFNGKHKISFLEYIDIIRKFTLKRNEDKTFIHNNLETYINRIEKGIIFKKKDLVDFDNSNYAQIKSDLEKKFPIYSKCDKFPYSIVAEFMEHLGKNIDDDIT